MTGDEFHETFRTAVCLKDTTKQACFEAGISIGLLMQAIVTARACREPVSVHVHSDIRLIANEFLLQNHVPHVFRWVNDDLVEYTVRHSI